MFELFIFICIIIFLAVIGSFIPIGNENSTVRRLPWVTFTIMGLCVLIYFASLPEQASEYEAWLRTAEARQLREEFNKKLMAFVEARKGTVNYRFGFAPNGEWKFYQLVTCAFLHGGYEHLFGNMI